MADINELIKKIALNAIEEQKPVAVVFGEVTSTSPLKITIDQKLTLTQNFLILTNNVRDHDVYMTFDTSTGTSESHSHTIKGKKKIKVHNGLSKGERVILIRFNHGQRFLVLDRVVK